MTAVETSRQGLACRFAFMIPFKPSSASADWNRAQENLRRTIRSAQAAAVGHDSVVVVACHEEPDLGNVGTEGVLVRVVPFAKPQNMWEGGRDKARKRRFAAAVLREVMDNNDTYVMFLDADDLVHRDLVNHVLSGSRGSYLVDQGYFVDIAAGVVRRRRSGFHRACGSSFVCRFGRNELPSSWEDTDAPFSQFGASPEQRGHQDYDSVAAELGRPPVAVPFPAVAYLVNHPESLRAAKGRASRTIEDPFDLVAPGAARKIVAEEFAAPDLALKLAGGAGVTRAFLTASKVRLHTRYSALAARLHRHVVR